MSKEQLTDRMVCAAMGIDSWKLQKWELSDEEFARIGDALSELSQARMFIDDSASMNLLEIKSKCRRLQMESGLDLIVIDYLQLINVVIHWIVSGNLWYIAWTQISRSWAQRPYYSPLSSLVAVESRANKEPILSDLRESGSIEQDADIVLMIYREEYYNNTEMNESDMNKENNYIYQKKKS